MSIEDRLRVVKLAEIACTTHSDNARNALLSLKTGFAQAATPWRIVTISAIAGYFAGRSSRSGGGADGGGSLGAKLFGSVAQALITTLGASATAGMAAGAAADAAAEATVDAAAAGAPAPRAEAARAAGATAKTS